MKRLLSISPAHTFKLKKGYRIQVYNPELTVWTKDWHAAFDTSLRIVMRSDWRGFGFCVLGFGFAADWQAQEHA